MLFTSAQLNSSIVVTLFAVLAISQRFDDLPFQHWNYTMWISNLVRSSHKLNKPVLFILYPDIVCLIVNATAFLFDIPIPIIATNSISRVVEQQRLQLIEMTRLNSWWHLGQVSNDAGCNRWSVVLCKDPYPAVIDGHESVVTTGLDEGVMVMTLTELDNIVTSLKDVDVKRKLVLRLRLSNK